jgi:cell division protein FtsB
MAFIQHNEQETDSNPIKRLKFRTIKNNRWKVLIAVIGLALFTVLYVYNVMQIDSRMKEVQEMSREYDKLHESNNMLRSKLNQLHSADRIIKIAREEIGLVPADSAFETIKQNE